MFGKRGVMETTDDRKDDPADGLLLGKAFAPAGARYFCPWWQKYPKTPFKGKGISYFPFPLKIPIP